MTRKSIKGIYAKSMSEKPTDPIIENEKLPAMDDASGKKTPGQEKGQKLMDKGTGKTPTPTKKDVESGKMMAAFSGKKTPEKPNEIKGEQLGKSTRKSDSESYLVFRMHVQNGIISVKGCKKVNSPLTRNEEILQGGLTYEVTLKDTRLNLASIPDFGEQRSFPRPGEQGHHITILPGFDFNVRVPNDNIKESDLPKIKISLYRFKEHVPSAKLSALPLKAQFEREVRVVAELNGIEISKLDKDVKAQVKNALAK